MFFSDISEKNCKDVELSNISAQNTPQNGNAINQNSSDGNVEESGSKQYSNLIIIIIIITTIWE